MLLDREPMALYCGLLSATASGIEGVTGMEQMQQLVNDEVGSGGVPTGNPTQAALLCLLLNKQKELVQDQQQQLDSHDQQVQAQQLQESQPQQQQASSSLPEPLSTAAQCVYRAKPFDWNSSTVTERYDVVLACDVLYEAEAADLVASVIPKLLKPGNSSTLLLADPPNRTVANREKFLGLISAAQPTRLLLQESGIEQCNVQQLDPEMLGGVTAESVGVQFMVFQSAVGNDTIGIKAL